ncbi:MAG: hypothetical protein QY314_01590 [Candidatus Dojkabacteria bacterium]|nr:MAG: hypothetical protein QY314_01590 [Candidatus Dojkabacteria bacterium]
MKKAFADSIVHNIGGGTLEIVLPEESEAASVGVKATLDAVELTYENLKLVFDTMAAQGAVVLLSITSACVFVPEDVERIRNGMPENTRAVIMVTDQREVALLSSTMGDTEELLARGNIKKVYYINSADVFIRKSTQATEAEELFWAKVEEEIERRARIAKQRKEDN